MNFNDFVIFFIKSVNNVEIVGKLLSEISVPVPLLYEVNKKLQYFPDLLKNVLSINSYHLILNIGSPQTSKCGKTKLLTSIFSLDRNNSHQTLFSNVLSFYTKFAFGFNNKAILADFNGVIDENSSEQLKEIIFKISSRASWVIFHAKNQ